MTSRPDPKFGQSKFKMKSLTKWNFCWKFWFAPFNLYCCWAKTTKKEAWYTKELNHFNASQIARKKISFLTNFVMKTETIGHKVGLWHQLRLTTYRKISQRIEDTFGCLQTKPWGIPTSRGEARSQFVQQALRVFALPKVWYWNLAWNELLFWWRELSLKDKTEGFTTKYITETPIMSGGRLLRVLIGMPQFAGHSHGRRRDNESAVSEET